MLQAGDYMQFVSIDWTLVFQLCNTLILFLLLKKFFSKPAKAMIDSRAKEVSDTFAKADAAKAEAAQLKAKYEESLRSAREEAGQIVKSARTRAQKSADEIVSEAQAKASDLQLRAQEEIVQEKKRAMGELQSEIGSMAVMIASKIVEKDMNEADHEKLIQEFIRELGDESWKA